jgi:hypothetical protein
MFRLLKSLVGRNPYAMLVPVAAYWIRGEFDTFLLLWIATTYAAAFLTLFVPPLRFLGEGFRYVKFAAFPVALVVARGFATPDRLLVPLAFVVLSLYVIGRLLRARPLEMKDDAFADVVRFVRESAATNVAVLPTHKADPLVALTRKNVLWGGHTSGYDRFAELVPVLQSPFLSLLDRYGVDLVVIDGEYVDAATLHLEPAFGEEAAFGRYVVLRRAASSGKPRSADAEP